MTLIDSLRAARDSASTLKLRLMVDYRPNGQTIHAFFEGREDESFYVNYIDAAIPAGWRPFYYRCGSKLKVCDAWRAFAALDQRRLLFFVDKDHDDIVGVSDPAEAAPNVFVTEWYSIENYLVEDALVRRYVRDILHLDLGRPEEDAVISWFSEQRDWFYRQSLTISAWIVAARMENTVVHVANVDMEKLFTIDDAGAIRKVSVNRAEYLRHQCGVTTSPVASKLLSVARDLRGKHAKTHIRGKFDVWFLVAFLRRLPMLLEPIYGPVVHRIRTPLSCSNALEVLGPRTQPPAALQEFLVQRMALCCN